MILNEKRRGVLDDPGEVGDEVGLAVARLIGVGRWARANFAALFQQSFSVGRSHPILGFESTPDDGSAVDRRPRIRLKQSLI
jgi:hypothetical protein